MSCGARLPIYSLFIPAFFAAKYQAFMMWLMYLIGVIIALVAARIMKSTLFKGDGEVFLMELPPYRMPTFKSLMLHLWDRGRMYLQKAGTIILATSVILFICNTYPVKTEFSQDYDRALEQLEHDNVLTDAQIESIKSAGVLQPSELEELQAQRMLSITALDEFGETRLPAVEAARAYHNEANRLKRSRQAELMEYTVSGRIGHCLEPIFKPIGFDWKLTTAAIGALAAKEVFVSQLGILYAEGGTGEESVPLREQLAANYSSLQGFCIMLFCLLSIPCLATIAIIRRELNSWKMALSEAAGFFLLAYLMTLLVYQLGGLLHIGTSI